jgi:hypothetical protein
MQDVGSTLRAAGVGAVYLVHGTFVGPDALGLIAELARLFPSAAKAVRGAIKRLVNQLVQDAGNYTEEYARLFESAINGPGTTKIPVRLFIWSSENHHIGRADGAVRLIDRLETDHVNHGRRILLWGHSHAGNVFALATNLLAGNRETIDRFFGAAEVYYRWPIFGFVDIPVWRSVRELLSQPPIRHERPLLDVVTFGTPVRYGWDTAGYSRLLHFINHRPAEGLPEYLAPFPPTLDDVINAAGGDYVQQLGIAGTNVMPSLFAWRAWLADRRLNGLLQADTANADLVERFKAGAIVPEEGTTLLVDYGPPDGTIATHHAGHAVYTGTKWLLFHAEEVARQLYSASIQRVGWQAADNVERAAGA